MKIKQCTFIQIALDCQPLPIFPHVVYIDVNGTPPNTINFNFRRITEIERHIVNWVDTWCNTNCIRPDPTLDTNVKTWLAHGANRWRFQYAEDAQNLYDDFEKMLMLMRLEGIY